MLEINQWTQVFYKQKAIDDEVSFAAACLICDWSLYKAQAMLCPYEPEIMPWSYIFTHFEARRLHDGFYDMGYFPDYVYLPHYLTKGLVNSKGERID